MQHVENCIESYTFMDAKLFVCLPITLTGHAPESPMQTEQLNNQAVTAFDCLIFFHVAPLQNFTFLS